ncbi:MAG: hypothetical protein ABL984_13315 [Pyrinomonadaceae bacterium]
MFRAASFTTFLVFALVQSSYSQHREQILFWSDQTDCGSKKLKPNADSVPECGIVEDPNGPVRTLGFNNLKLFLQFAESKERFMIRLRIENLGDQSIALDRELWSDAHYESEVSFKSKQPPILNERVSYRPPPRVVAPHLSGPTQGSSSNRSEIPGLRRTTTSIEAGRVSAGPQQIPAGQGSIAVIPMTSTASTGSVGVVSTKGLPKRSPFFVPAEFRLDALGANSSGSGVLYFRQVKKSQFKVVFIHLGDTTFVFQVVRPTK